MGLSRDYEKGKKGTMGDLIDRQAAIDALKGMAVPLYKDPACEDIWERDRTLDNAIDAIRGLPSAQPEIIRCKDCKHWDGVDACDVIDVPVWDNDFCSMAERRSNE